MSEIEQFQVVVSEIQSVRQQMASLNAQIMELKATSDAVTNQPAELSLHQQLGGILMNGSSEKKYQLQGMIDLLNEFVVLLLI